MRWEAEWSLVGRLYQKYLYQKLLKSDNWFSSYSWKCRGCFFETQCSSNSRNSSSSSRLIVAVIVKPILIVIVTIVALYHYNSKQMHSGGLHHPEWPIMCFLDYSRKLSYLLQPLQCYLLDWMWPELGHSHFLPITIGSVVRYFFIWCRVLSVVYIKCQTKIWAAASTSQNIKQREFIRFYTAHKITYFGKCGKFFVSQFDVVLLCKLVKCWRQCLAVRTP